MQANRYIDILNSLCNMFIDDGQVPEEVIEMLIDAGATISELRTIGFSDAQISDYAYYEANMSGRTEEQVMQELQKGQVTTQ